MISPTKKGIRTDLEGSGEYGANRGNRIHNGVDYLCDKDQYIIAPFDMQILRIANPKAESELSGIEWKCGKSIGKLFYFLPDKSLIGKHIREGDSIGIAQSVSKDYGLVDMKDHVHFQIDK